MCGGGISFAAIIICGGWISFTPIIICGGWKDLKHNTTTILSDDVVSLGHLDTTEHRIESAVVMVQTAGGQEIGEETF